MPTQWLRARNATPVFAVNLRELYEYSGRGRDPTPVSGWSACEPQ